MKKAYLSLFELMLLAACEKESYAPAVSGNDLTVGSRATEDKILKCHYSDEEESWSLINISRKFGPQDNSFGGSGDITTGSYWTSTEYSHEYAWRQFFNNGGLISSSKDFPIPCRCVRK